MINAKVQHGIAIIPAEQKEIVVELKHPVDMERAFIAPGGSIIGAGISGDSDFWDARFALVDNKHLSIKRAYPSSYPAEVSWQVCLLGGTEQAPEPEKKR